MEAGNNSGQIARDHLGETLLSSEDQTTLSGAVGSS
jgi:hypothetical protein